MSSSTTTSALEAKRNDAPDQAKFEEGSIAATKSKDEATFKTRTVYDLLSLKGKVTVITGIWEKCRRAFSEY